MQNEIEVMRVIRTPPMGSLLVETTGERVNQLASIRDDKLRRRILAAIGELIAFAGGYDVLVQEGVAPALPSAAPQQAPAQDEEELSPEQTAFLERLERELRRETAPETAENLEELLEQQSELERSPGPGINLVAEIDEILQRHVVDDQQLAQRSIHLRQSPGELLQIIVDGRAYEHPNDIEDERVRQALKRALKEWESR